MLSFGSTDDHTNSLDFGDLSHLEGNFVYALGFWVKLLTSPAAERGMIGDGGAGTTPGWKIDTGDANTVRIAHRDTATNVTNRQVAAGDWDDGTTHSIYYSWDGSTLRVYMDGVLQGTGAQGETRDVNTVGFIIGNDNTKANGFAGQFGHVMYWHNFSQSSEESDFNAAIFHQGQFIPRPDKLTLWHKGLASPGLDELSGTVPTAGGTVSVVADAVDAYYQSSLEQFRLVASHRLLRRKTEEQIYSLEIPIRFLNIELMDLVNVSHDSIPRSETRLTDLSNGLNSVLGRYVARAVGINLNPLKRTITLKFKDHESFMATYWSTDQLLLGTNSEYNGLARLGVGGTLTIDRNTFGYLEQENDINLEVSQNTEGQFFKSVAVGNEKINHIGLLAEDSTDNPILNNCAKNGETSWTSTDNGGTTDLSTLRLAYPSTTTTQSFRFARSDNSNSTYRSQTFAVLTADGTRRICVTASEEDNDTEISWRLQRSTDSEYWNDSGSGSWQVASVWNTLQNSYDASNLISYIFRDVSNEVDIDSDENWTIDVGLEASTLPVGGGEGNVYSVSALKGPFIYSEVPTNTAAVTTEPDIIKRVKTSGSQIVSATRGSLTFDFIAIQAGATVVNNDHLCLYYWQYGSTEGQDYDAVLYQKLTGLNRRFAYERWISGVLDARATYDVTIVPGTVYKIGVIWTAESGEEADSFMRIVVNSVVGTDDTASANHDDTEPHTELWIGCAPDATGYLRANNYLRNVRFWPRPLTVEEIPS